MGNRSRNRNRCKLQQQVGTLSSFWVIFLQLVIGKLLNNLVIIYFPKSTGSLEFQIVMAIFAVINSSQKVTSLSERLRF